MNELVESIENLGHEVLVCCDGPPHEGQVVRCVRCGRGFIIIEGEAVFHGRIYPDRTSQKTCGKGRIMSYRYEDPVPDRGKLIDVRCDGEPQEVAWRRI